MGQRALNQAWPILKNYWLLLKINDITGMKWLWTGMNYISHLFSINTNMNVNEKYFYVQTRSKEIKWERMIFTVYEWEQIILQYPQFWSFF